jgi:sulfate-transporting ATPase
LVATVLEFLLLGLASGGVFALLGHSIVIVHSGSRVLNFAAAAQGVLGAYIFYNGWNRGHGLWWPVALLISCAVSAGLGVAVFGLIMYPMRRASATSHIVATLGLFVALMGFEDLIFAPNGVVISVPTIFPSHLLRFGGLAVQSNDLVIAGVAIVGTGLLVVWSARSRLGLAVRANAESPAIVAAMGWSTTKVGAFTWALGSVVATIAVIFAAPLTGLGVPGLAALVLPAMVAALLGRFESFWATLIGAFVLGVGEAEVTRYITTPGWPSAIPLLLIVAILMVRGSTLASKAESTGSLPSIGPGTVGVAACAWFVALGFVLWVVSINWIGGFTVAILVGLIVLSVVIVSGYAGQLSLAQFALAGFGALASTWLVVHGGFPLWLAIVVGAAVTVPVGLIVGIPALRSRGSDLAIATLALATVIVQLLLTNSKVVAPLAATTLPSLALFGVNFNEVTSPRAVAFLVLVVFAIAVLGTCALRRGAIGRRMIAVRTNERAAAAMGISATGTKVVAFGVAAFLAALAGGLLEAQLTSADFSMFSVTNSINGVLEGVIGGLGWASSPLLGAAGTEGGPIAQVLGRFSSGSAWLEIITGAGVVVVLLQSADGLVPLNIRQYKYLVGRVTGGKLGGREPKDVLRARRIAQELDGVGATAQRVDAERASTAQHLVTVSDVRVAFGGQKALDGVSLIVSSSEIVGLIGPNGAGKSTLMDVICALQPCDSGSVAIAGRTVDGLSPARRARMGIGRSFQGLDLFEDLTVLDNLQIASDASNQSPRRHLRDVITGRNSQISQAAAAAVVRFGLESVLDARPNQLDYAQRRLVAIARALASDPRVVLLDEPAAGLDETERATLAEILLELKQSTDIGVLVVEHDVDFVCRVSDRIVALDAGRVIAEGPPEQVRKDRAVTSAYLGTESDEVGV